MIRLENDDMPVKGTPCPKCHSTMVHSYTSPLTGEEVCFHCHCNDESELSVIQDWNEYIDYIDRLFVERGL